MPVQTEVGDVLRVVGEDLVGGLSLGQEPDDGGDRDPGATHAGKAAHDAVVGDNAGLGHGHM